MKTNIKAAFKDRTIFKILIISVLCLMLMAGTILFAGCGSSSSGTQWLTGTETPSNDLGSNGDFYLDTDDYILYQKTNGYWTILMRNFGKAGEDGEDGADASADNIEISLNGDVIQWRYISGSDTTWKDLLSLSLITGANGDDGKQIELRATDEYIQYRYEGDTTWINLMQLSAIKGSAGATWTCGTMTLTDINSVVFGSDGDFYLNSTTFDIFLKSSGTWTQVGNIKGQDAANIELQVTDEEIQWRYTSGSDTDWKTLIYLSTITGATGQTGADGKKLEIQVSDEYIQYRYEGDEEWTNLMELSALKGASGATWISGTLSSEDMETYTGGNDGDFYLNTSTFDIYQKSNGTWTLIGNIKGEDANNDEVNSKLEELENLINNGSIDITRLSNYQTEIVYNKTNLIDESTVWVNDSYIHQSSGVLSTAVNSNVYVCTKNYIPVTAGETYVLFVNQTATTFYHYSFYDATQTYISGGSADSSSLITAPSGAYYFRFTIRHAGDTTIYDYDAGSMVATIELYNQSTKTYSEPYVVAEVYGLDADTTLIDGSISAEKCDFFDKYESPNLLGTVVEGKYCNTTAKSDGSPYYLDNSSYVILEAMDVTEGYIVNVWQNGTSVSMRMITMLDSTGTVISTAQTSGYNTYVTDFTIPEGCASVIITISLSTYNLGYIQVQCTSDGLYLGYYEPGVTYYYLNEDYYFFVESSSVHYYLPSEICVATDVTIDLYYEQIVLEADDYHFQWIASITNIKDEAVSFGRAYERLFRMTGTEDLEGCTGTLTLNLYDDDLELQYTMSATVKFVSATIDTDQLIIPIGDSLTNSKLWLSKVNTLSNGMITYRGTQGTGDKTDTTTMSHEGRSGAGTGWYNSGTSKYTYNVSSDTTTLTVESDGTTKYTTNPFWNPKTDKFDFDYYCNSTKDGGAGYFQNSEGEEISITPTGVQIYLGTNGMSLDSSSAVENLTTLVNNIRNSTKGENVIIYIVNTIFRPTQIFSETTDGYSTNSSGEFSYRADMKVMNLEIALYEALGSFENVVFIPVAATMDREYNFPYEEVAVNPYSDVTMKSYTDCVHPSTAGYYQMADIMFSTIAAHYKDNDSST